MGLRKDDEREVIFGIFPRSSRVDARLAELGEPRKIHHPIYGMIPDTQPIPSRFLVFVGMTLDNAEARLGQVFRPLGF